MIVENGKLLLVNAWRDRRFDLMCAPGGGVELHSSLPDNLKREVLEETGLEIEVGPVCLINEFHDPDGSFHQVDIYFRCQVLRGEIDPGWQDPERVVTHRRWVSRDELSDVTVKPDSLAKIAFGDGPEITYDPLEPILR